jgi:hypothetical protein
MMVKEIVLAFALCLLGCSRDEPAARSPPQSHTGALAASNSAVADELCSSMCSRGQALHCGTDTQTCLLACGAMLEPPCDQELRKVLECFVREPLPHWECGLEGLPAIRSGYCDAPQAAAARCLERESAR